MGFMPEESAQRKEDCRGGVIPSVKCLSFSLQRSAMCIIRTPHKEWGIPDIDKDKVNAKSRRAALSGSYCTGKNWESRTHCEICRRRIHLRPPQKSLSRFQRRIRAVSTIYARRRYQTSRLESLWTHQSVLHQAV